MKGILDGQKFREAATPLQAKCSFTRLSNLPFSAKEGRSMSELNLFPGSSEHQGVTYFDGLLAS